MAGPARPYRVHHAIDSALPFVLVSLGLLSEAPAIWYRSFAICLVVLCSLILGGAGLAHLASQRFGTRIQGPRRKPPPLGREAFESARAMWVMSTLAAWPIMQWQLGHPTGMILDLRAHGIEAWQIVLQTLLGVVIIDAWLYWKHRILHSRTLFGFHRQHHTFRDPTPFAGFAVGPFEALLTFWPVTILCIPEATHWAPLYAALVIGFVTLNFYLHCGVTLSPVEATLPRLFFNTSAFHNVHHSHANANFGEALYLWDRLCKTRLRDRPHVQPLPTE
jgi:sterol desaturase/sphingolipid hydroxylase (fatty acid hydroxylase superfamily)